MEWLLEIALIGLLGATLFHALRLERALGVLKQDRAALQELVAGFNASTRQAEQGIDQLRLAADGAGRQLARQIEAASALKGDLAFLTNRGERLADKLDGTVRAARDLAPDMPPRASAQDTPLLAEDMGARSLRPVNLTTEDVAPTPPARPVPFDPTPAPGPGDLRVRSQAERDLLKALQMAR